MSTIQEQFEAMLVLYWPRAEKMTFENSEGVTEYWNPVENLAWKMWQAATEAAKATGTAGDLPPLPKAKFGFPSLSEDGFNSDQMREYGQACAEAALAKVYAIAVEEKAKMDAEAARQPASVAKVLTDEEIDVLWSEVLATNPLPQPAYRALVRAALAATNRSQP